MNSTVGQNSNNVYFALKMSQIMGSTVKLDISFQNLHQGSLVGNNKQYLE